MIMNKTALLDTNILVYMSKPGCKEFDATKKLLLSLSDKGYLFATSSFAVAEYYSYKANIDINIENLLTTGYIKEIPFGHKEAMVFSDIRTRKDKIHPIDATHIATALSVNANVFITNDRLLHKIEIEGLEIHGI